MNEPKQQCNRHEFTKTSLAVGSMVSLAAVRNIFADGDGATRIKVGGIGCGSVSHS